MKKLFILSIVILFSAFLSGCLQSETKVYVNEDGSGVLEETVLLKDEVVEMMEHFAVAFDSSKGKEFDLFNQDELISKASKFGEGVSFSSSEKLKLDGYEGVKAKYLFKDITKLNLSLVSDDAIPMASDQENEKNKDQLLRFSFSKVNGLANLKVYLPSMDQQIDEEQYEEEMSDSASAEEFEQAKELFRDMRISLVLVPSGKIKQTNADYLQNNEITLLEMNMNSILDKPELFQDLSGNKVKTLDELREMVKNIEGIKIDSHNVVEIIF